MAFLVETGPNSGMIQTNTADTPATLMSLIQYFVTSRGWSVHDAIAADSVCFVAPNADGVTSKYVVVVVSTSYVFTKVYESWNAVTHVGTNLAQSSDTATHAQRLTNNSNNVLHIACSPRYMVLFSKNNNTVGNVGSSDGSFGSNTDNAPTGIIEISRDNEGDTPDKVGSTYAFVNFAYLVGQTNYGIGGFSFPVSPLGGVGISASTYNTACTLYGRSFPETTVQKTNTFTLSVQPTAKQTLQKSLPQRLDPSGLRPYVLTLYAGNFHPSSFFGIKGRFFGAKIVGPSSALYPFDRLSIPVDVNGFYDEAGTPQPHFLLRTGSNPSDARLPGGTMIAFPL